MNILSPLKNAGIIGILGRRRFIIMPIRLPGLFGFIFIMLSLLAGCNWGGAEQPATQSLSLEITTPSSDEEMDKNLIRIRGTVSDPEARVTVNGAEAEVGENGKFLFEYLQLEEGKNTIEAVATLGKEKARKKVTIFYNQELSVWLFGIVHRVGEVLTETPVEVTGLVSDSRASVTINGESVTVDETAHFSTVIDLSEGENVIEAIATLGDHEARDTESAVYRPKPPLALEIASPVEGAESHVDFIKVTGSVSDSEVEVLVNGVVVRTADDGSFYTYIDITEGENTIAAVAARGTEKSSDTVTVSYSPPSTGTATDNLSLRISSPEDGVELRMNLQKVSGTISDPQATVVVNGIEANMTEDGSYHAYIDLMEGENTVRAVALKGVDKVTQAVEVTFAPALVVYLDAEPDWQFDYTKTPLPVTGIVNKTGAKVTVNGEAVAVASDGSFTAHVLLVEGANSIEAVATLGDEQDEAFILYAVENGNPVPVPGYSHWFGSQMRYDDAVEIKAGDTKIIDVRLETRKNGPGEYSGRLSYVSHELSEDELPLPEGLKVSLDPIRFKTYPNTTYHVAVTIETSSGLAQGEYYLRFLSRFVHGSSYSSEGWIKVTVEK